MKWGDKRCAIGISNAFRYARRPRRWRPTLLAILPQQIPSSHQGFQSRHFNRWIDAGAPEDAAVFVLVLEVKNYILT